MSLCSFGISTFWQNQTMGTSSKDESSCILTFLKWFNFNFFVVTIQHLLCLTFCFAVGKCQHIQALRNLTWRVLKDRIFFFITSLSPLLVKLDVCVHALQLHRKYIPMVLYQFFFLLFLPFL